MEHAFLANGPALIDAALAGPVITPNERLAREISRCLASAPALEGRSVTCRSWQAWLRGLYELSNRRGNRPRLLTSTGFALLVSGLDGETAELHRPLIEEAWMLRHHFGIAPSANSTPEECWSQWHDQLEAALREQGCITAAELENTMRTMAAPCSTLTLAGFDALNPAQQQLLDAWRVAGCRVNRLDTPRREPVRAVRIEVPLAGDELRAAAWWAREILEADPEAHIGVLVPGLDARRDAVLRQFGAIIDPFNGSDSPRFDVSGGTPLSTKALWRDCELLLQSLEQPVASIDLLRLLRSPHLTLEAKAEPAALPALSTLEGLARLTGSRTLMSLVRLHAQTQELRTLAEHLDTIHRLLKLAGWAHSGMGSTRFQIQQATARALQTLTAEAVWQTRRCTFGAALRQLNTHLAGVVHAPERPPARLRIMGYLETPGLAFTHLWVTGADESALPAPARPNPLLSMAAMRLAGVPRMDARSELAFTKQLTQLFRAQTGQLVVSHAALETGEHVSVSGLLADLPPGQAEAEPWIRGPAHAWLAGRTDQTVPWTDTSVEVLPPQRLKGGTSLLADQAICSFRAFACHRLMLPEPEAPHDLMDPLERGTLLHDTLESLMHSFPSRTALSGATVTDLEDALDAAFKAQHRDLPAAFVEAETTRLLGKLQQWQAFECARAEFSVVHVEHKIELDLAGYRLGLKFDRIDDVDGRKLIIDYKSGAPESFGKDLPALAHDRPQLPAYACAMPEAEGVFYLHFKDEPAARGLCSESVNTTGLGRPKIVDAWQDTVAGWRDTLVDLIERYASGPVVAVPADAKLCQRCHIRPICRIDTGADDDGGPDDVDGDAA